MIVIVDPSRGMKVLAGIVYHLRGQESHKAVTKIAKKERSHLVAQDDMENGCVCEASLGTFQ